MKNFLFFFFALKTIISVNYEFEPIKEIIPKSSCLIFPGNSFKIYEYIPILNNDLNVVNETKSIYIKIYASSSLDIFIYDNYSKIEQDSDGIFINYIDELPYHDRFKKLENLICNKAYYFVLFNEEFRYNQPVDYQFFILDEINNIIRLNPSLSSDFNFFQTSNKPMKFNYKYENNKITLIRLSGKIKLQIFENDKLIYNHDTSRSYTLLNYTFIKNKEYNIIFEDLSNSDKERSTIYFQFFDDEKYLKYNYSQSSLLLLDDYEYSMEVDISKYSLGKNIIFLLFSSSGIEIKYQYKNEYKGNNLINLGRSSYSDYTINYIRIKKEKDYNNLIISIKSSGYSEYSSINLLKYAVEDIPYDTGALQVTKETVFYLDYFHFNQYDSFGFYSKQKFLFLEQSICNSTTIATFSEKVNLKIIKKEFYSFYYVKNALVFFSRELNDSSPLVYEVKKFNFPIIYKSVPEFKVYPIRYESKINQYLQLSQNNEFYFYVNYKYSIDVFLPIFGKYETIFIKEEDIETLSDLDFDKKNESDYNICGEYRGYLKIKNLNDFSMLQHFILDLYDSDKRELDTGKKYHFLVKRLIDYKYNLTIKATYVNKIIALKFRVFGLKQNKSIVMIFDENRYELNSNSLEIKYDYKNIIQI